MHKLVKSPVLFGHAVGLCMLGAGVFLFVILASHFGWFPDDAAHAQMPADTKNVARCKEFEKFSSFQMIALDAGSKKLVDTYRKAEKLATAFGEEKPVDYKKMGRVHFVYFLCLVQSNRTPEYVAAAKAMGANAADALKLSRQTGKDIPDATVRSLEEAYLRQKARIEAVDGLLKEAVTILEHPEKPLPGEN